MYQYGINWKTKRTIDGIVYGKRKEIFKNYFYSFYFTYMLFFSIFHYFFDKDSIFINTFGVAIIDILASFVYYSLYILEYKRNQINIACKYKKLDKPYKIPLIDKNIGDEGSIAIFKLIIFLLLCIVLVFYYGVFGYILQKVEFMSLSNSFDFVMFFISVAYFDMFFEGDFKYLTFNINRIKFLVKDDIPVKRIAFYMFLSFVAIYQFYTIYSDLSFFIN